MFRIRSLHSLTSLWHGCDGGNVIGRITFGAGPRADRRAKWQAVKESEDALVVSGVSESGKPKKELEV